LFNVKIRYTFEVSVKSSVHTLYLFGMLPFFLYLIRISLSIALVFVVYGLVIRRLSRLTWNRIILVGGMLLSLTLPLSQYRVHVPVPDSLNNLFEHEVAEVMVGKSAPSLAPEAIVGPADAGYEAVEEVAFNWYFLLFGGYLLGVLGKSLPWIRGWMQVRQLKNKYEGKRYGTFRLYRLPFSFPACSHFGHVFVGKEFEKLSAEAQQAILAHEEAHVRLGHSWDILLLEAIQVLCWFHPLIGKYRLALQEIHEYQADKEAIKHHPKTAYARLLVSLSQVEQGYHPGQGFARSLLKARVRHLFSSANQPQWHYAALFLLMPLLVVTSCTQWEGEPTVARVDSIAMIQPPPPPPPLPDSTRFIPSIRPTDKGDIYSGFGMRKHPILKTKRMHLGVDIIVPKGTPVRATADGVVSFSSVNRRGYGKMILLDHDERYRSRYAHLDEMLVKVGEEVERGQVIAYSGNTGLSERPHLHYEIQDLRVLHDSVPVRINPKDFMPLTGADRVKQEPSAD